MSPCALDNFIMHHRTLQREQAVSQTGSSERTLRNLRLMEIAQHCGAGIEKLESKIKSDQVELALA